MCQLTHYKKVDLAVEVFNQLDLPLVIIGEGELLGSLKKIANKNITLLGRQPFEVVKDHLERCKALIFPGVEDFGIVPLEAQAAGAPVIAYAKGGVLDTVIDNETGLLFHDQTIDGLMSAVKKMESKAVSFDVARLHQHTERFSRTEFKKNMMAFLQEIGMDSIGLDRKQEKE